MRDLETLLPPPDEYWALVDEPFRYQAKNLFDFINGAAEIFLEYGFVEVISQEYERGEDAVVCAIYQMEDPQAAFGIFSYTRSPQKRSIALGDGAFVSELQLVFWQDRYFVKVESFSMREGSEEVLTSFAERISNAIGAHAPEPAVIARLPRKDLIPRSEKLLEGRLGFNSLLATGRADAFDLEDGDRVVYGEYGSSEKRTKLFLLFYGRKEKLSRAESALREGSRLAWRRGADYLAIVAGATSTELAEEILGEVR